MSSSRISTKHENVRSKLMQSLSAPHTISPHTIMPRERIPNKESLNTEKTIPYSPSCSVVDIDSDRDTDSLPSALSATSHPKRSYLPFPDDSECVNSDIALISDSCLDAQSVPNHENLQPQRTDIFCFDSRSKFAISTTSSGATQPITEMGRCHSTSSLDIPGVSALSIGSITRTERQQEGQNDSNQSLWLQNAVTVLGEASGSMAMSVDGDAVTLMGHFDGGQEVRFR